MNNKKIVSIDLWANMAVLKKPDVNKDIYLTYNILHKPMLLGILGAIIGLDGYKKNGELPEYYKKLRELKVGIQPLQPQNKHFKASYQKTNIVYNNSVGYASQEEGGNLIVTEQTLIEPWFRCYLLIDFDSDTNRDINTQLYNNLKNGEASYIPYIGKNEFQASWMDLNGKILFNDKYEYNGELPPDDDFQVLSIFSDDENISPIIDSSEDDDFITPYFYFEHLPFSIHETLLQYEYKLFKYTNAYLKAGEGKSKIKNLYPIGKGKYVYLF